jgi:streptogramin lyase
MSQIVERITRGAIVIALLSSLLSSITTQAQAVVPSSPTCAQGGVCQIGDIGPGGGKVFYIAPTTFTQVGATGSMCTTNCKYLESALNGWNNAGVAADDPMRYWATDTDPGAGLGNQSTSVTGASGTAVGTGFQNSVAIVNQSGNVAASSAAVLAREYQGPNNLTDWYLPSKDELRELYLNKATAGGFQDRPYWTSSESEVDPDTGFKNAWFQSFLPSESAQSPWGNKDSQRRVRPIRAFAPARIPLSTDVCWAWNMENKATGNFLTDGSHDGVTAAANTYTLTDFNLNSSIYPSVEVGSISDGTYSFGSQRPYSFIWNGTAPTVFQRGGYTDNYTNGLGIFNGAGTPNGGYIGFGINSSRIADSGDGAALFSSTNTITLTPTTRSACNTAITATKIAITRAAVGTQRRAAFTTQPQVTIQASNNDTVTASSAVVTATVSAGGTLIGTTTATASSGVATFSNLGVDGTIGTTYTISYTALDLPIASTTVTLTGTTCDGITFTCQVGDTGPGGGKIFYVAPTTFTQPGATISMCSTWCKYLEAAPSTWSSSSGDPTRKWVGPNYETQRIFQDWLNTFLGTDGVSIGSGYQNSEYLRGTDSSTTANSAAALARAYTGGGKSDWYLPSKNELDPLYAQRAIVGGISDARNYWSSTESNDSKAWYLYTAYSNQQSVSNTALKTDATLYARPIRAFGTAPTAVSISNVAIPAPVRGATPVSSITSNGQYTTGITWSGSPSVFDSSTAYTATVTVTPVAGYTLNGVGTNFFTVNGSAPTSVVSPIAASLLGTTGVNPIGITVDSSGNVYTANFTDNNVTKITPQGVTTIFGTTGLQPTDIVIDASGNIYTSNLNSNNVTKITPSGVSTTFANTGLGPSGIAIDSAGNVYTANANGNSVTKITPIGGVTNIPCAPCVAPRKIAVDHLGSIFTTNSGSFGINPPDKNVTKITSTGVSSIFGTVGRDPWGIAVDAIGNVYVSNFGEDTVTKILPNGDSAILGRTGGLPWGVAVDSAGNVYTANATNGSTNAKVTKISPQGIASTLLPYPAYIATEDIAVDSLGNVYVVDAGNQVLRLSPTNSGVFTYRFPATAAPTAAPVVVAVAQTPVPYIKTLTKPKLNLKDGKLSCTPGTYNAGYTLDGVVQGSTTALFTPSSFTYNLLINGITQTSLAVTSSNTSASWNIPASAAGALITCSVTVSANGVTTTDKSGDNTSGASSALTTQTAAIATANATYSAALSANTKAYQKALVDNRTQWRSTTEKIRTDYYAERNRINSLPSTKATRALSSAALKAYTAALKKSAADYKASGPAALAAKDVADKAALTAREAAIAKANAAYGTAIESIGYGVLIP